GLSAAFILFGLRMIQGLCLGGEYGGAITYVAEHVSDERRGYYTGWLQTSPTLGIVVSLAVIIATRTYFGTEPAKDLTTGRPIGEERKAYDGKRERQDRQDFERAHHERRLAGTAFTSAP